MKTLFALYLLVAFMHHCYLMFVSIPWGYEDEAGFHYGIKPRPQEQK
jgi:hypothetical protein